MTFTVVVRSAAKDDIAAARDYYRDHARHEVRRFRLELRQAIGVLTRDPLVPRVLIGRARALHLKGRFPYALWFIVSEAEGVVDVIALVHDRQEHSAFKGRTDPPG